MPSGLVCAQPDATYSNSFKNVAVAERLQGINAIDPLQSLWKRFATLPLSLSLWLLARSVPMLGQSARIVRWRKEESLTIRPFSLSSLPVPTAECRRPRAGRVEIHP